VTETDSVTVTERLSEQDDSVAVSHCRQQFVKHCRRFSRLNALYTVTPETAAHCTDSNDIGCVQKNHNNIAD